MKYTADNLTADEIHEVHRTAGCSAQDAAHALGIAYPTSAHRKPTAEEQHAARVFIAETLRGRAEVAARIAAFEARTGICAKCGDRIASDGMCQHVRALLDNANGVLKARAARDKAVR